MGCLSDKYTQRIVSGLEIIKLWPTVAHVHRKVPIEYNGEPQIRPQNTPSCGPIAKPHHLPHPWTSPTYGAKLHPDPIHRCSTMHWTDRQIVHGKVWRLYVAALRERRDLIISDCRKPKYAVSHYQSIIIYLFTHYSLSASRVQGTRPSPTVVDGCRSRSKLPVTNHVTSECSSTATNYSSTPRTPSRTRCRWRHLTLLPVTAVTSLTAGYRGAIYFLATCELPTCAAVWRQTEL